MRRSTKRSADREVSVRLGDLWPKPACEAALATAVLSMEHQIRVWVARPDKPHSQTKLHVHVEDLDALLRLVYLQRKLLPCGVLNDEVCGLDGVRGQDLGQEAVLPQK